MNHSETQPQHPRLTDDQAELLPALLDGQEPGAYVVIQVEDLSMLMVRAWHTLARERREMTQSRFQFRLLRMLSAGDFIVNTKYRTFDREQVGQ